MLTTLTLMSCSTFSMDCIETLAEKFTIRAVIKTTPFHKITHSPELLAAAKYCTGMAHRLTAKS